MPTPARQLPRRARRFPEQVVARLFREHNRMLVGFLFARLRNAD